ncbi:hypothetical protein TDB9533_01709 [Thalassocella blandensis]|nr:hypothetical protein TDB9533_01709 [Thalassocella blandensis]
MKIAIIGAGISGLTCAHELHKEHDITVFESAPEIGGHTATKDIELDGQHYAIDTGFIVYNDWTYPNFIKLLEDLNVATQPTDMSFSVHCTETGLEYGGSNLNTLFAQRRNLFKPSYLKMLRDIVRFNKEAIRDLEQEKISDSTTLGEYLASHHYGEAFVKHYLVPMGCAIWSASTQVMLEFPLLFFVRFFKNHGLLSVANRPQWHVIKGGSREYLKPLTQAYADKIQTSARIESVIRRADNVHIKLQDETAPLSFDQVIFACHSDQALAMLTDASLQEKTILQAIPYKNNEVVLHTDESLLPHSKRAWSSWNYCVDGATQESAVLTYNMNILQGIQSPHTFCVTLNATDKINPEKILGRYHYEHPVFSLASVAASNRWSEINGVNKTWFCGAYWGNGFHEDGVASALRVTKGLKLPK